MLLPIYLDYAATTPLDPRVVEKMMQYLTREDTYGNPSSTHLFGQKAKNAIDVAREQVADLIEAEPSEIIWTSGATEANNLALKGAAALYKNKGKHIVTVKTEHPSVLDCCQQLEKEGFSVTYLTPQTNGLIDVDQLHTALRADTILVSIMHVNNEIGVIQDIKRLAELTSTRGVLFHVDAAQSAGKISFSLNDLPIDLMSFSAHKIYGPKGIGALYVRRKPRVKVAALIHGGGHERGMRSGTLATHQIVGMGEAFYLAKNEMKDNQHKIAELRSYFISQLSALKSITLNQSIEHCIANIINLRINQIPSAKLMQLLPNIAISAGSACHAKDTEPSYVLRALGYNKEEAACAVRLSLGKFTTKEQITDVVAQIARVI